MLTQLAITFGAWLVLLYASINLIGLLVRGFFTNPEIDKMAVEGSDFIKKLANEHQSAERKTNITALILLIAFFVALYYFWNIGVVIAALIIMAARIPDLVWEIRHGRAKIKEMPAIYMLTLVITLASLPVLWYALYQM